MKEIVLAGIALAVVASGAQAHSMSEETIPADAATVLSVEVIELRFDDPMRITAITLTGPNGELAIERETGMDPVKEFRALPPADLPDGAYKVNWRGMASDGHPMQGAFGFTLAD
ncbi:MAG: copper resistance CopC family protein [Roseovarius sp.]